MKTPTFYNAPAGGPRLPALVQGGVAAAALIAGALFLMGRGGQPLASASARSGTEREGLVPTARATGAVPVSHRLLRYFRDVPLLGAIDTDHDQAISDGEMVRAPSVLRALDLNRDGSLNPEECGFEVPPEETDRGFIERSRKWYMRVHPVLAALDADGNGLISPVELATAAASLRALDWDHDGRVVSRPGRKRNRGVHGEVGRGQRWPLVERRGRQDAERPSRCAAGGRGRRQRSRAAQRDPPPGHFGW